jgi:hypothetical protein
VTPQFGAYLTIVINDHETFIVQATGCGVTNDLHLMTRGVVYAPRLVNYAPRVFSYAPRVINSDHRVKNSAPMVINYAPREHL